MAKKSTLVKYSPCRPDDLSSSLRFHTEEKENRLDNIL